MYAFAAILFFAAAIAFPALIVKAVTWKLEPLKSVPAFVAWWIVYPCGLAIALLTPLAWLMYVIYSEGW